ncbi:MAG: arylsulfatase [Kiritimatiellaceae bacterium]|nr:arylsulfatase [Kiritimatiellaceae bacterium]
MTKGFVWLNSVLAVCGTVFGAAQPPSRQPNVILILTDDQGYGDLGCHGNAVVKTPHLDQFYKEAVRFTNFHVSPTCAPTRAALLTGRYNDDTGVWHTIKGRSLLRTDEKTLGDMFHQAGYATGMFGKWHLGDNYEYLPEQRGFEEVWRHGGGGIGQTPDYWGNDYFDDTYWVNGKLVKFNGFCTEVWFRGAKQFIAKEVAAKRPFFCYLALNAPHAPYYAPEKYKQMYENNAYGVDPGFFGMITHLDEQFGLLRTALKELGVEDNTILIFMTDNGTSAGVELDGKHWSDSFVVKGFNDGMRGKKGSAYEGGHRVPFFIRWPGGGISGGRDINTLSAHIDILPTLANLCSVPPPKGRPLDGTSLVPLLRGDVAGWPQRTICTDSQRGENLVKWKDSVVMTERWRLVRGNELYEIKNDPEQRTNLAGACSEIVTPLRSAYENWWQKVSDREAVDCPISIGNTNAGTVLLTAHDWHSPDQEAITPWDQKLICEGMQTNGFWAIRTEVSGQYRFTLRRWPAERGGKIEENFFPVKKARIQIGGISADQPVDPGAESVVFELPVPIGEAALQTWFIGDNESCGAYYVEVEGIR